MENQIVESKPREIPKTKIHKNNGGYWYCYRTTPSVSKWLSVEHVAPRLILSTAVGPDLAHNRDEGQCTNAPPPAIVASKGKQKAFENNAWLLRRVCMM